MPERTWIKDPLSLLFRRRRIPKDIRQLIDTICIVDAARAGRFKRLRELGEYVSHDDLTKGTGFTWKSVRGDISTILDLPRKDPTIARYASLIPMMSILIILGFLAIVIMFTLKIYNLYVKFDLPNAVAVAFFLIGGLLVARWYMEERIGKFYEKNPTKSQRLGRFNQALMDHLVQKLTRSRISTDFQMRLFNIDYSGISVVKKPGLFREWYVVKIGSKKTQGAGLVSGS